MALGSTQPLRGMSIRNITCSLRRSVLRADNLTTFVCHLSWNLEASTSCNRQSLSRTAMGLIFSGRSDFDQLYSRLQLQTSRKKRSWTPHETMAMRRCRNRSNDLILGGRRRRRRWWWWWWWWWYIQNHFTLPIHQLISGNFQTNCGVQLQILCRGNDSHCDVSAVRAYVTA